MIKLIRETILKDVLEEIVTLGEGYKTEFKATLPSPPSIAKSLCAFSNTKGGNLFIGINDSGIPIGVSNKKIELTKLEEALPLIIPNPDLSVKTVTYKDIDIILIEVKEGKNKPYYMQNETKTKAYIRAGDVNLPATKKILRTFINGHSLHPGGKKGLKKDNKIVFNLFKQNKRLSLSQIRETLNYSERRLGKILKNLSKHGLIIPSQNERNVYYLTNEASP